MENKWYKMTKEELFDELNTTEIGLTSKESAKRLEKYGKNILPKKEKESIFKIFLREIQIYTFFLTKS